MENRTDGFDAIKLIDEPFSGIVYTYGNISVSEEADEITFSYEYEILDRAGKEFGSMEPFEQYIGDVLQDIIHQQISEHDQSEKEQSE